MRQSLISLSVISSVMLLLSSCGGGSGGSSILEETNLTTSTGVASENLEQESNPEESISQVVEENNIVTGTGYYVDSAISGVSYKCGTQEGITAENGAFTFEEGENCIFTLNGIVLRDVESSDLKDGEWIVEDNIQVAQLLQSLDDDGDAVNGIVVRDDVLKVLEENGVITLPNDDTELKEIIQLLDDAKEIDNIGYNGRFIDQEDAQNHLDSTKNNLNGEVSLIVKNDPNFVADGSNGIQSNVDAETLEELINPTVEIEAIDRDNLDKYTVCDLDEVSIETTKFKMVHEAYGNITVECTNIDGEIFPEYNIRSNVYNLIVKQVIRERSFSAKTTTSIDAYGLDTFDYKEGTVHATGNLNGEDVDCVETYSSILPLYISGQESLYILLDDYSWLGYDKLLHTTCPADWYYDDTTDDEIIEPEKGTMFIEDHYTIFDMNDAQHHIYKTTSIITE